MELSRLSEATSSSKSGPRKSPISPLEDAIRDFKAILSNDERSELMKATAVPDVGAVMKFTAELDLKRLSQSTRGRSFASRIFPFLQRFQSFASIVSTFVSSNPAISALVWGSVQLTIQASSATLL
jgi:hypothetical protein